MLGMFSDLRENRINYLVGQSGENESNLLIVLIRILKFSVETGELEVKYLLLYQVSQEYTSSRLAFRWGAFM